MDENRSYSMNDIRQVFPIETQILTESARESVKYAIRTNVAVASVLSGYGVVSPSGLNSILVNETLQSSMFIFAQEDLAEAMTGDPGNWVSPVDLFSRGYLMSFELMLCRGVRSAHDLWGEYTKALAEHPDQDMMWLHDLVTERVSLFGEANRGKPGPHEVSDEAFAEIARMVEARVGRMFLESEPDAQAMIRKWWQCLVDGTIKGAIAVAAIDLTLSEAGQESVIRRYGCTGGHGQRDDWRIQATVTKVKDF